MFLRNLMALAYAAGALAATPYDISRRSDVCIVVGGGSGGGTGGGSGPGTSPGTGPGTGSGTGSGSGSGSGTGSGTSIATPITHVYIYIQVVSYPVSINSYITANTIININGGVTININNAPTYLQTTVTATSTTTITSTASVTITNGVTITPTPPPTPFIIAVEPVVLAKRHAKRQSFAQSFVGPDGVPTTNCTAASVFTIQNGQLSSEGELVTTNTGTFSMPLAASPIIGNISTYFAIYDDVLFWNNSAFTNGSASFCNYNSTIEAIFIPANVTSVCTPVNLVTFPASDCVVGVMETSTSSTSLTSTSTTSSSSLSSSSSGVSTSTAASTSTTTSISASSSSSSATSSSLAATSSSISTDTSSIDISTILPTSLPTSLLTLPPTTDLPTSASTSIELPTDSSTSLDLPTGISISVDVVQPTTTLTTATSSSTVIPGKF